MKTTGLMEIKKFPTDISMNEKALKIYTLNVCISKKS